ncbi:hypothetical protein DL765_010408 [Monosporascus sp. GIB2]|nr:hypothetical protein DL765_010408 [Monosporascus sp. GIB2]
MNNTNNHRLAAAVQRGRFPPLGSSLRKLQDKVRELPLSAGNRRARQTLAGVPAPATPSSAFSPSPGSRLAATTRVRRLPAASLHVALAECEDSGNTGRNGVVTTGNDNDGDNGAHGWVWALAARRQQQTLGPAVANLSERHARDPGPEPEPDPESSEWGDAGA